MNPVKLIAAVVLLSGTTFVLAAPAQINVDWSNPTNYKDIRSSGSESQADFERRLFTSLEKVLTDQAGKLPEDSRLEMRITDVTLAGLRATRVGANNVRVSKDGYPARLEFQFSLSDRTGKVLKEGNEQLRSSSFAGTTGRTSRNEPFHVEKKLLRDWFQNTLLR